MYTLCMYIGNENEHEKILRLSISDLVSYIPIFFQNQTKNKEN